MSEVQQLLTVGQASKVLGVSQGTIRGWLGRGLLRPTVRIGRRIYFVSSDLQSFQKIGRSLGVPPISPPKLFPSLLTRTAQGKKSNT